jgi:hypothetical protein
MPFVILAIVWAGFAPTLKLAEMINERRDKIMDVNPETYLPKQQRLTILYSDWLLYSAAGFFYLLIFVVMFVNLPYYLEQPTTLTSQILCYIAAIFPAIFCIVLVIGCKSDYRKMIEFLDKFQYIEPPSILDATDSTNGYKHDQQRIKLDLVKLPDGSYINPLRISSIKIKEENEGEQCVLVRTMEETIVLDLKSLKKPLREICDEIANLCVRNPDCILGTWPHYPTNLEVNDESPASEIPEIGIEPQDRQSSRPIEKNVDDGSDSAHGESEIDYPGTGG